MGTLSLGVLLQGKGAEGVGTRVKYVPRTVWQGAGCRELGSWLLGEMCPGEQLSRH